ncbi:HAD family phosphatase [Williamsia sp. CHRR-6]|uniref:HAD family hydrolase n=1 Tax=Williamsia sp. CHRR-6 TaxID=2835871 RepID=UPI0027DD9797|nr:HAD family phosphatase [Williamsia sp. CHRR-6]
MTTERTPDGSAGGLPDAVLWDMDGTLLDSEKLWDVAMIELALELGIVMTHELRRSTLGNSMRGALSKVFDAAAIDEPARDYDRWSQWLRDRVSELFDGAIPWRPGAVEALDTVAGLGIAMVLVTNTERGLTELALRTIGRERFTATICGDEVPAGKPAPDIYLAAAALVGADPSRCLAVEDSPTGTQAATSAGCPTLVVPSEMPVPDGPRRTFRDGLIGLDATALAHAFGVRDGSWETDTS